MTTDAEFVAAIRAGDTAPWGSVFDRYRDGIWQIALSVTRNRSDSEDVVQATFLKAVESLDQLRDPDRLRPWLLSIARSKALDRVRRRTELPTAAVSETTDMAPGPDRGLHQQDVAALVVSALAGLEGRDRAALELAERQGLSGEELAEALGVTRDNAYAIVHNARSRFSLAVESVVVARTGQDDCPELRRVLGAWEGRLDPLLRKRVARHIEQCQTCTATREREVTPAALLNLLPAVAVPSVLADKVRAETIEASGQLNSHEIPAAHAVGGSTTATKTLLLAVAAVATVSAAVGALALSSGDDDGDRAQASAAAVGPTVAPTGPEATNIASPEPTTALQPASRTLCETSDQLRGLAGAGPASGSARDVEVYMMGTNRLLAQLAQFDESSDTVQLYAAAYQSLIDDEAWNIVPLPSNPELVSLRDALEAELSETCPGS
ncbi:MAG: RNA polymerase sigma factor [Acidimicrobiales bacterium]